MRFFVLKTAVALLATTRKARNNQSFPIKLAAFLG